MCTENWHLSWLICNLTAHVYTHYGEKISIFRGLFCMNCFVAQFCVLTNGTFVMQCDLCCWSRANRDIGHLVCCKPVC